MEEFCKVLMEAPFLQEVVLFLIITYIHQNKKLIVLTGAYCIPVREKIISLDHECLKALQQLERNGREAGIHP